MSATSWLYAELTVWRVDLYNVTTWPCDELVMWRVDWQPVGLPLICSIVSLPETTDCHAYIRLSSDIDNLVRVDVSEYENRGAFKRLRYNGRYKTAFYAGRV